MISEPFCSCRSVRTSCRTAKPRSRQLGECGKAQRRDCWALLLAWRLLFPMPMSPPRHSVRHNARRGFTLLEILVVIALISLLTTGVAVGALTMLENSKKKQAATDAASLASVAEAFVITNRDQDCPTPEELSRDGLLSHRSKIEDPWGTPYRIRCEPSYAVASSAGPDGAFDTDDDIRSDDP